MSTRFVFHLFKTTGMTLSRVMSHQGSVWSHGNSLRTGGTPGLNKSESKKSALASFHIKMAVCHITNTEHRHGLVLDILNLLAPNTKDCDVCTL